jgi:uncharacterized protein DUF6029
VVRLRKHGSHGPIVFSAAVFLWAQQGSAADVGQISGDRVQLDVTETTIAVQHFDPRENELPQDSGWGAWLNRLNAALRWGKWTAGLRLDSAVYWRRPVDNPSLSELSQVKTDNETRYENAIYPAKLWVTYSMPSIEVTAGDAYVQFGRGLTLSMRKIDELGIDTTLRGAKVQIQKDPFAVTMVAGFGNPSRIDEASGRSLFPTHDLVLGDRETAVFGSDRIVGIEVQAGRGLPVTLSTHAVQFTRCAPYAYAGANIVSDFWQSPSAVTFGTCNASDTAQWLQQLGNTPPPLGDGQITMVGQSLEVPKLWGHGKLYLEAAGQDRRSAIASQDRNGVGNAIYAAMSFDHRPLTATLEIKSNRNFYAVPASVSPGGAPEFSVVTYSFLPPAETFNMIDTEGTGNFNACVDGGRLRADVNVAPNLMLYAQGIYAYTKSENTNGSCDQFGHTINFSGHPSDTVHDHVWDGIAGLEWTFDDSQSHAYVWGGVRDDTTVSGDLSYREQHIEYSIAKYLGGPWAIEVQGRHRHRKQVSQNDATNTLVATPLWWAEGENYVALKLAPSWVFTQGFEYTTLMGQPPYYFNGGVFYKFTSSSNVRVSVGQQRGAFRCASGVCRYFPPFEGARCELTWRF